MERVWEVGALPPTYSSDSSGGSLPAPFIGAPRLWVPVQGRSPVRLRGVAASLFAALSGNSLPYLTEQNEECLSRVVCSLGQSETWVTNTLLEAALQAVSEGGGRLLLPLRFQLEDGAAPLPWAGLTSASRPRWLWRESVSAAAASGRREAGSRQALSPSGQVRRLAPGVESSCVRGDKDPVLTAIAKGTPPAAARECLPTSCRRARSRPSSGARGC
ncbi:MAG: hypothetical protein RL514_4140 [Verrucomicrobiota bacterium]